MTSQPPPEAFFAPVTQDPWRLALLLGLKITHRQLQILAWVQEGKSASDIGAILDISGRTVDGHILKLCNRLGVRTRLQAVLKARELGLIEPSR